MSVIHNVPYVSFSEGPKLAERESVPIPVTVPHSTSPCVGRTAKRTERSATPTVCKYWFLVLSLEKFGLRDTIQGHVCMLKLISYGNTNKRTDARSNSGIREQNV